MKSNKISHIALPLFFIILIMGCSSDGAGSIDEEPIIANDPEEAINEDIPEPSSVALIFPENNSECFEGEIENETHSKVTFNWTQSNNTDSYEVVVINQNNRASPIFQESVSNETSISILRGVPYEWYVISRADGADKTSSSEVWQFYNAGKAEESHAPFPAKIIYPRNGAVLSYRESSRLLEWEGNDVDNDIVYYELFLANQEMTLESKGTITETSWRMNAEKDLSYYWQIKTTDSLGNSSFSELSSFYFH